MGDQGQADRAAWEGEMFRLLAANVVDYAIFVVDPHRHVLSWNKGAELLLGFTEGEIVGKRCDCFFTPEDVERGVPQKELDDALRTGRGDDDRWHVRKDGTRFWAGGVVTPLRDEGGTLRGFAKIMRDRTELKRAADATYERGRQRNLLTDHAPVLIAHVDAARRYKFVNKPFAAHFDLHPREVVGRPVRDVRGGPAYAAIEGHVDAALAGERVEFDAELPDDGRGPQVVRCAYDPEFDDGGRVVGFVAALVNVTEARRARDALRESEGRLRALSDNLPDGAVYQTIATPDGGRRFALISAGVERLFGVTPAEALADANALYALVHEGDRTRVAAAEDAALRGSTPFDCEFRSWTRSGELRWVHCRSAPRRLPAGGTAWEGVVLDVTARKRAEADLASLAAESERQRRLFDTALSNTTDYNFLFDPDGRVVYANRALLALWGRTAEQVAGRTLADLGYPADAEAQVVGNIRRVVQTGQPVKDETRYSGPDPTGHFEYILAPVLDAGGAVVQVAGSSRDISNRMRAEEQLRAGEGRFRAIVTQATVGVAQADLTGRYTLVNPRYCGLVGYSETELLGMRMQDITHPDDLPGNLEQFRALVAGGPDFVVEKRYARRDGSHVWVSNSVTAVRDAAGRPEGVLAVTVDLTDRRRAEAAVRESERRFREMADTAPVALWTTDPDGRCTFLSREWYEFTGQMEAEALGLGWTAATHPDDEADAGRVFLEANAARTTFRTEYRLRTRGGAYRWAMDIGRPRYSAAGEYLGMVGAVFDLEDRRQAEQALRDADRRKDDFLATLAHELRNPLAPLRNGLQILRLTGGDAAAAERAMGMMDRQLAQMVHLIDDLLDVSRITRGKLHLRRGRVDLATVVQSAVEASRPLIEASAHRLAVALPPDPVFLDADPTRLAQVLSNLLTNAAKYTERGGDIRLTAERRGGEVSVSVRDTGIGISAEHLPRLFEMFSQVDSALERTQGGLGIGLALVKGLVEMHGGTVEARSDGRGRGCEVVVRLPAAAGTTAPAVVVSADGEGAPPRPRRRVLVADDNRDAADSLATMLQLAGHEVHAAHDGQEAVEAAGWFRPDVVLMDIGMPRLNGYEACRRIRGQPWGGGVTVVALTGWGQDDDKRRAADAGFDHHLTKPVDPAALESLLAGLVPRG